MATMEGLTIDVFNMGRLLPIVPLSIAAAVNWDYPAGFSIY